MNKASALFLLFTLASVGPVLGGVAVYHDNLFYLILPHQTMETLEDFQDVAPYVTYLGYEVIDPERALRVLFDISNPYNTSITVAKVHMECYCHEHGTKIGVATGENDPLDIASYSTGTLSLVLHFTEAGKNDVLGHRDSGEELYLDLKNLVVTIEGVEASYEGDVVEIGPVPLEKGS